MEYGTGSVSIVSRGDALESVDGARYLETSKETRKMYSAGVVLERRLVV